MIFPSAGEITTFLSSGKVLVGSLKNHITNIVVMVRKIAAIVHHCGRVVVADHVTNDINKPIATKGYPSLAILIYSIQTLGK